MQNDRNASLLSRLGFVVGRRKLALTLSYLASTLGILASLLPYLSVYKIAEYLLLNPQNADMNDIFFWVIVAGVGIVCNMVFSYLGTYGNHRAAFNILFEFRVAVIKQLGCLSMGFFADNTSGSIQKTMNDSIEKVEGFVAHLLPDLIGSTAVLLVLVGALFMLNVFFALVVIAVIAVAVFVQFSTFGGKRGRVLWTSLAEASGKTTAAFSEYINGIAEVKLFGLSGRLTRGLENNINKMSYWEKTQYTKSSPSFGLYKALVMSMLTFLMPVGLISIMLHPGNEQVILAFLMALILTPAIYNPFMLCLNYGAQLGLLSSNLDAIYNILEYPPIPITENPKTPTNYDVEFRDVSFSYQNPDDPFRKMALDNFSIVAKEHQMTALVGPSGSGKSTVGQLLTRFWDIESGSIMIGGVDIRSIDPTALMNIVSVVLQDTFLFSTSIYDNLTMNHSYTQGQVEAAAKAAQCHDFIMQLPNGYQSLIGAEGTRLSGGEAQRLAIARVLLKGTPIVVLDEALAFSDAENENLIQKAINELVKDRTVIVVAHRLQSIRNASHIYVLNKGRVQEDGVHHSLMALSGEYHELWNLQQVVAAWELKVKEATS